MFDNKIDKTKIASYFESWKKVFRDKNITAIQKVVLKDLEIYRNTKSGYSWPSLTTLAEDIGVNERTVRRAMDILEQLKLVEVLREKGKVNKYKLARKLTYPLHEIEANHGHESPYFTEEIHKKAKSLNEPWTKIASTTDMDVRTPRTPVSNELYIRTISSNYIHTASDSGESSDRVQSSTSPLSNNTITAKIDSGNKTNANTPRIQNLRKQTPKELEGLGLSENYISSLIRGKGL